MVKVITVTRAELRSRHQFELLIDSMSRKDVSQTSSSCALVGQERVERLQDVNAAIHSS